MKIQFRFLDDQQFEVHVDEELVLAGTYRTEGLKMILSFTVNEIYDVGTLTLYVITS